MHHSKYKGYCHTCWFTIFKNERVVFIDNKIRHVDCILALEDSLPRIMNKKKKHLYGQIKRTKLAQALRANPESLNM